MATRCPICGNETLEIKRGQFRFDPPPNIPGGIMVFDDQNWLECSSCGEQVLSHELTQAISLMRYDRFGLLQPSQIRAIREKTGLSQESMAICLGVGEKTYTRWESGKSLHNKSSDNLIRLFDKNPEQLARFEAQRRPERLSVIKGYFKSLPEEKGENLVAMAAHGADLDPTSSEHLRETLRKLAAGRDAI